jgi:hypothetical protein
MASLSDHPSAPTGTIWIARDLEKSDKVIARGKQPSRQCHYRECQAQGDCFYLAVIGSLQTEDPGTRVAHLQHFQQQCQPWPPGWDQQRFDDMVAAWGVMNVFRPTDAQGNLVEAPVFAVSELRALMAEFFWRHWPYYNGENDEFHTPAPRWMGPDRKNCQPEADFRTMEVTAAAQNVHNHFRCWHGGTAPNAPFDEDNRDAVRTAYYWRMRWRYPDGVTPIQSRTMSTEQMAQFGNQNGDPMEKMSVYANQIEAHIAAQMFGVNMHLYFWIYNERLWPTRWDARISHVVQAVNLSGVGRNGPLPWLLLAIHGTHYNFFETAKWAPFPLGGKADGRWMRLGLGGSGGADTAPPTPHTGGGGHMGGWGPGSDHDRVAQAAAAAGQPFDPSGMGGPPNGQGMGAPIGIFTPQGWTPGGGGPPPGGGGPSGSGGGGPSGSGGVDFNPLTPEERRLRERNEALETEQIYSLAGAFVRARNARIPLRPPGFDLERETAELSDAFFQTCMRRHKLDSRWSAYEWGRMFVVMMQALDLEQELGAPTVDVEVLDEFFESYVDAQLDLNGGSVALTEQRAQKILDEKEAPAGPP